MQLLQPGGVTRALIVAYAQIRLHFQQTHNRLIELQQNVMDNANDWR